VSLFGTGNETRKDENGKKIWSPESIKRAYAFCGLTPPDIQENLTFKVGQPVASPTPEPISPHGR
jgi:hypothetical protein